ncbi:MAG: hypothetical protein K0S75_382 [Clostridia bacterium]|jgi:hypothetical protein|nr:hypothetical protein [Clostridia bacterium]
MRRRLLICILMVLMLIPSTQVFADVQNNIQLDGFFEDWVDKPSISDEKHNSGDTWKNFLNVGYFADDEYLYLRVERLSANKSEPWRFYAVMLNATEGNALEQHPFGSVPVYAPQFEIVTQYDDKKSHEGIEVSVIFEGNLLETTLSSENNAKEIEFRIPLESVGLNGLNKDVKFILKSDDNNSTDVDWVADGRPIIITTGPTLYEFTTIVCFAGVSFAAYKVIKKRNKKISFS